MQSVESEPVVESLCLLYRLSRPEDELNERVLLTIGNWQASCCDGCSGAIQSRLHRSLLNNPLRDSMSSSKSVTHWIGQLKAGNRDAAQKLWEAYFHRLVGLARKKL